MFVSSRSVSGLSGFKEHISRNTFQWLLPNLAYAIRKILLKNFSYVQYLNIAQWKRHGLWPQWNEAPVEKALWLQLYVPQWFIDPMSWFCERLFFFWRGDHHGEKKNNITDTLSIKISSMFYIKWTRLMLPAVSEEFDLACIFFLFFFFSLSFSIGKGSALAKIWRRGFYGPGRCS